MNSELAEAFFHNIYDTHIPNNWGDCCGEHEMGGFEAEQPGYPCELYKSAAQILGLPVVEWVKPPPRIRTPEEEARHEIFMRFYGPLVEMALRLPLFTDALAQKSEGDTVTFWIKND